MPTPLPSLVLALVLCGFSFSEARAQRFVIGGWGNPPRHGGGMHGHHRRHGPVYIIEREVVVIERETPPPPAAVPLPEQAQGGAKEPPPPRKPYVIGASYSSLPGGCMKMIEAGGTYYFCGGDEWYQQTGTLYRAVSVKL